MFESMAKVSVVCTNCAKVESWFKSLKDKCSNNYIFSLEFQICVTDLSVTYAFLFIYFIGLFFHFIVFAYKAIYETVIQNFKTYFKIQYKVEVTLA